MGMNAGGLPTIPIFGQSYDLGIVGSSQAKNLKVRFYCPTIISSSGYVGLNAYLEELDNYENEHDHSTHYHEHNHLVRIQQTGNLSCISSISSVNCGSAGYREGTSEEGFIYPDSTTSNVGSGNAVQTLGHPNGVKLYINGADKTNDVFGSASLGDGSADIENTGNTITSLLTQNAINTFQLVTTAGACRGQIVLEVSV